MIEIEWLWLSCNCMWSKPLFCFLFFIFLMVLDADFFSVCATQNLQGQNVKVSWGQYFDCESHVPSQHILQTRKTYGHTHIKLGQVGPTLICNISRERERDLSMWAVYPRRTRPYASRLVPNIFLSKGLVMYRKSCIMDHIYIFYDSHQDCIVLSAKLASISLKTHEYLQNFIVQMCCQCLHPKLLWWSSCDVSRSTFYVY